MEKMRINKTTNITSKGLNLKTGIKKENAIAKLFQRIFSKAPRRKKKEFSLKAVQTTRAEQKAYTENYAYYLNETFRKII
jgi:hypothetical protein